MRHKIQPTCETISPSGGLLIYAIVDGTYFKRRYFGTPKREALADFKRFVRAEIKNPSGNF